MKRFNVLAGLILLSSVASMAGLLPYTERATKYVGSDPAWDEQLKAHYAEWKSRFVQSGVVVGTDPNGKESKISEGQSYGMLLALWFNDEAGFKAVWNATNTQFWTGTQFKWRIATSGNPCDAGCENFAGDADQDIVGALIFASALQDSGYWKDKSVDYNAAAKKHLAAMGGYLISNNLVRRWYNSDVNVLNPSYFEYHWYPVFKDFAAANSITGGPNWDAVRTATYTVLNNNSTKGLARNWCNQDGSAGSAGTASKPTEGDMGFDAIRVPWRVALDNIWYQYPAAGKWCKNVWDAGLVKPAQAGMFTLSSKTSGALWGWGTAENSYADAQYEKYFTAAMWAACAVSVKDSGATQASAANSLKNYVFNALRPDAPYFTLLDETAAKNYYSQTLALFGSLAIVGRAWNVWDDLKKPWVVKDTSVKVTTPLAASVTTVTLGSGSTVISAKLAKSIAWTVNFTGVSSGRVTSKTGTGTDISFSWTPSTGGTKPYVEEDCKVELTGGGWATPPTITLKLTKSAGIATRMRAASALAWTNEGLIVPAGAISTGMEYSLREMDLQGKVVAQYPPASAQLHDANLLLPIQRAKTQPGLRILEARGSDGSVETLTLPLSR